MRKINWTPELDNIIGTLWLEGHTLEAIKDHLVEKGYPATRSAVSGRMKRIDNKRKKRGETPLFGSAPPKKKRQDVTVDAWGFPIATTNPNVRIPKRTKSALPIPDSLNLTMMDAFELDYHWCRWPTIDDKFCCAPADKTLRVSEGMYDGHYCPYHHDISTMDRNLRNLEEEHVKDNSKYTTSVEFRRETGLDLTRKQILELARVLDDGEEL